MISSSFSWIVVVVLVIVSSSTLVHGMYEDEVGENDWYVENLGEVNMIVYDSTKQNRVLYVGTKHNVIAAVRTRKGKIGWRQVLAEGEQLKLIRVQHEQQMLVSVSGSSCDVVRVWSTRDGTLYWESNAFNHASNQNHTIMGGVCDAQFVESSASRDGVLLLSRNELEYREGGAGTVRWRYTPSKNRVIGGFTVRGDKVYLVEADTSGQAQKLPLTLVTLSARSGSVVKSSDGAELDDEAHIYRSMIGTSWQVQFVKHRSTRLGVIIRGSSIVTLDMDGSAHVTRLDERVDSLSVRHDNTLLLSSGEAFSVDTKSLRLRKINANTQGTSIPCGTDGSALRYKYVGSDKVELHGPFGSTSVLPFNQLKRGTIERAFCYKYEGTSKRGYTLAITTQDHTFALIKDGTLLWLREEALASIVSVYALDQPALTTFDEDTGFPSLLQRMGPQLTTVKKTVRDVFDATRSKVLQYVESLTSGETIKASGGALDESRADYFGFRKYLMVMTRAGKLMALDAQRGGVMLSWYFPAYVSRSSECSYDYDLVVAQHRQCRVVATSSKCASVILNFDCINERSVVSVDELSYSLSEWQLLPYRSSEDRSHILLLVDTQNGVRVYPNTNGNFEILKNHSSTLFMHRTRVEDGVISGFAVTPNESEQSFSLVETWSLSFPVHVETIADISKAEHHVIQSRIRRVGKVVNVKYLNPNLMIVATTREMSNRRPVPSVKRTFDPSVNIYVVDAVTGTILHRAVHRQCKGPVHVAQGENSVVYHYFNIAEHRYEVSVMDLYEEKQTALLNNDNDFSSHRQEIPVRKHRTYIFPTGVRNIAVTHTRLGISDKKFLFALNSNQILGVPFRMLDPHRPMVFDMNGEEAKSAREAGLIPYRSDIPLEPQAVISYYRAVHRIQKIHSFACTVESTSLVFVHGLDVFFARVTPVSGFDRLNEAVDGPMILITLVCVAIACLITRRMSKEKATQDAWR